MNGRGLVHWSFHPGEWYVGYWTSGAFHRVTSEVFTSGAAANTWIAAAGARARG